ncbi:hypothetical protein BJ170DRAFT_247525 [Xylariales sp. AK1849]|nr:hypothetical protein BJ170DRAFT_247525 [Xylariales sp. AK1849]
MLPSNTPVFSSFFFILAFKKMQSTFSRLISLFLLAIATASFTLNNPMPIIITPSNTTLPCGGFNIANGTTVTQWPVNGHDVSVSVKDFSSFFDFKAALLSDLTNWVSLRSTITISLSGTYCWSRIRGYSEWMGQDAVLQVIQYVGNGVYNYQCAAIKFTSGPYVAGCRNTGIGRRME